MDQVEDIERDGLGDRFGERDGKTQRVSDGETEKEVSAMLEGYDMGLSDRNDERSPPKLEIASGYRSTILFPTLFQPPFLPHAMDISSVSFRPVAVTAQAEMTSTHGHPRLNLPELDKVNIYRPKTVAMNHSTMSDYSLVGNCAMVHSRLCEE